jgi:hypothetical protein
VSGLVELGLRELILPLLFWPLLFFGGALALGLVVLRRCRAQLEAAGRASRVATAALALGLVLALPVGAGVAGTAFSLERSVGRLIERGGERVVALCAAGGERSLKQALGVADDTPLSTGALRAMIAAQLAGTAAADLGPAARIGHPLALLGAVPRLLERAYWSGAEAALLAPAPTGKITWRELVARTRAVLAAPEGWVLHALADRFYDAARSSLVLLLALLALGHGLALGAVALARRHLPIRADLVTKVR